VNVVHIKRAAVLKQWRYAGPAIFLHWVLAIAIAGMVGLGWYMMSIEREPGSRRYFDLHISIGLVVFSLVLLRLIWRFTRAPAALPDIVPRWQARASSITQWLLYACMVLIPASGFLGALRSKSGVSFFGIRFPAWLARNHDIAEFFFSIHSALAWALVALLALHAAAAFKHVLIDRDGVFQRMWF
jgi:cytochrome b561